LPLLYSCVPCSRRLPAQLNRVQKEYSIAQFGKAVDVFMALQRNSEALHEISPADEAYRKLPRTVFSDEPETGRANGFGDPEGLTRILLESQRL
jgi:hypothetical protein